jgi:hypothetical protein
VVSVGTTEANAMATTVIAVTHEEATTTAHAAPTIVIVTIGAGESPHSIGADSSVRSPFLHPLLPPSCSAGQAHAVRTAVH